MRFLFFTVPFLVASLFASGDYSVPGIDSDEILMPVNVWGEVRSPGVYMISWDSDLRDALSAAGGPTSTADLSEIRIILTDLEIKYNLSDYLSGEGAALPALESNATVYVAESSYEWWKDIVEFSYKIIIMANAVIVMSRI